MSDFQISEDERTLIENFRAAGFIGPRDPVPVVQKMRKWIEHLADRANTVATLRRYAAGSASRDEAIAAAGVRDYAELLPLLGDLELNPRRAHRKNRSRAEVEIVCLAV